MMKQIAIFDAIAIVIYTMLFLAQLWNQPFSDEVFFKLTLTFGVLIVAVTVIGLIYREFVKDREMKKDNYIA